MRKHPQKVRLFYGNVGIATITEMVGGGRSPLRTSLSTVLPDIREKQGIGGKIPQIALFALHIRREYQCLAGKYPNI